MARRKPSLSTQLFRSREFRGALEGAIQFVQDEKIRISRETIKTLQSQGRWPEEYNSYVISERRKNRYKDPDTFFRQMHKNPQFYNRRFIFRPVVDVSLKLKEATAYASAIVARQANLFTKRTGLYLSSFKITVDGSLATDESLNTLTDDSVVEIFSNAPYAGYLEAHSFYNPKAGGVLYYAASRVKEKYRDIGVSFSYRRSAEVDLAYDKYMVPVIRMGSRRNVIDTMKKPGYRIRRRAREKRALEKIQNKVRR